MTKKQQRLLAIGLIGLGVVVAVTLSAIAMRDTITFFHSPTEVKSEAFVVPQRPFRIGGLVEPGSVQHDREWLYFTVTDNKNYIHVEYKGLIPNLFKEGQGVVATGHVSEDRTKFTATELLAKHDENYMPPEVARALKKAHEDGVRSDRP